MAKGLIHGENGDTLQMESVFLIKLLSRFSWFELFHLVRWERAFPLVFRAALAALVCDAESTVLAEKIVITRRRNTVSVPKIACRLCRIPLPCDRRRHRAVFQRRASQVPVCSLYGPELEVRSPYGPELKPGGTGPAPAWGGGCCRRYPGVQGATFCPGASLHRKVPLVSQ